MSVYNGEKFLEETLQSITNQTERNFEFIIINDCSTDNSLEIIERHRLADPRIVILNNTKNLKLPASLNKGIKAAKGKYIARMDADDIALPNRFELQLAAMEDNQEIDFLGGRVKCFYDSSNESNAYSDAKQMEAIHFNFISDSLLINDTKELIKNSTVVTTRLCHSTLFGKTSAFKELLYTEDVFAEDWDLYNRAINRGYSISKIPDVIVHYRIVNTGMCGTFNQQKQNEIRKKIRKLNDGILYDCIRTKSFKNALKFYWYHYWRNRLSRIKHLGISFARRPIHTCLKMLVVGILNLVLAVLPEKHHRTFKKINLAIERRRSFQRIPFIGSINRFTLRFLDKRDIEVESIDSSNPRYNIAVWTIEKKWAMGGLNTIFKMIPILLKHGHKIRIVNYGWHSDKIRDSFHSYIIETIGITKQQALDIEVVSAAFFRNHTDRFNPNDKFIAGFWEPAEDFINKRSLNFFKNRTFAYVIQDYEPSMLYRWGSEYIRSKATFDDKHYYPIFNNSEFVCGYLKKLDLIDNWKETQVLHGEPCNTTPPGREKMEKDSHKISLVFYARPTVDKNIYDIKVKAICLFIDFLKINRPSLYKTLSVTGIGEAAADINYNGFNIKNLGKVDYKDYPELLKNFNLGLACIISPAFAYPCIEFPRAGIVTIVNRFENRDLEKYSKNIISCESTVEKIFEALVKGTESIPNIQDRIDHSTFQLPGVSISAAVESMLHEI